MMAKQQQDKNAPSGAGANPRVEEAVQKRDAEVVQAARGVGAPALNAFYYGDGQDKQAPPAA